MGIKTTTVIAALATLVSTSAFAGTATNTSYVKSDAVNNVHLVKAPVLLEAYAPKTKKLRIKRVVIQPVEALVARDASTADNSAFVFKTDKNPKTKTFRPAVSNAATMPNLFTK